jgi:type I restriction enzyme S subunit
MFGDPIVNEKGWEEGKMGEYCTITSSKRIFANEYCEEGVPFYRGKEITELSKDLPISIELYISQSRYEEIKRDYGIPAIGDILITAVGTIGNIWVVNDNSPFYFKDGNIVWVKDIKGFDPGFFKTILTIQISAYKHEMAQGCAYNALTIVNLKKMKH